MKTFVSLRKDVFPLLNLAGPLAFAGLIQSAVWFFETLFLARLGQDTLAAGALVSWLFGTLAVIFFGVLSSINILVAHKFGAKRFDQISPVLRDGILLSTLMALPAFILFWFVSKIFLFLGQSPHVVMLSQTYLQALAWGILPDLILIVLFEFFMGLGATRIIMFFTIFSVGLNILLSYLLIFGKYGAPALGIAGAGWGLTISYWICSFVMIGFCLVNKKYSHYFRNIFQPHKASYLLELIKIGLPIGVMYCTEVGFFLALTLLMGLFGSALLAANQIVLQYMGVLMQIIFSIAQAITVRISHLMGAKDFYGAEKASYVGIVISFSTMFLVAFIYYFFPMFLISIDLNIHDPNNADVIQYVKILFVISAIFQIFEAIRIALFGSLRGIKDTKFTLLISILSFWGISLPIGYLLANYFGIGGSGYWWAMTLGALVSVPLLYLRFKFKINYCLRTASRK